MQEGKDCWPDCYDIASSAQADKALDPWLKHINLRPLDVTRDLSSDELEKKYDVIVVSTDVLTPADAGTEVTNFHSLLRDGGKLVIVKPSSSGPSVEQLETVFNGHSFTGVDVRIDGPQTEWQTPFILVTTKTASVASSNPVSTPLHIVKGAYSLASRAIASGLMGATAPNDQHWTWSCNILENTIINPNETYIVLDTAENTLLLNQDAQVFTRLRELLNSNVKLISAALQDTSAPIATPMSSMRQLTSLDIRL